MVFSAGRKENQVKVAPIDSISYYISFDKGSLVILLNGFQKKTQKTPLSEIDKAEKLMREYYNEK